MIVVAKANKFVRGVSGEYHCEAVEEYTDDRAYFVVNLKYWRRNVPKDFEGSNLVGWYAVKKSDLKVYEVKADGNLGKRIAIPYRRP